MMNDFKEYSAAFHDRQNELMHYGVPGMKWDPSKRKKNGQKTEEQKKEDRLAKERTASNIASSVAKKQLGVQLAKAVYDAIPKKHSEITGSLKNAKLSGKKIANSDAAYEDRSGRMPMGGYTTTSSIAEAVLNYRKKEPTNPHNAKKTGLQKAATEVARKEEKKRNKKLINARKAERAYRRGGH